MSSRNNNPGRILKGTAIQPTLKSASGVWTINEALQAHRNNSWPQPNLYQPISNSLRFKYQNSGNYPAYQNSQLNHYIGRNGNQYAWTFSAWVKPSLANSSPVLFGASSGSAASGDYRAHINFSSTGNPLLGFRYAQIQIATYVNFDWVPSFRDPSAWYHIVVVFDSLNATLTNRMRAWVNGVQLAVSGTPTCTQGQTTIINQPGGTGVSGANLHRVGASNDFYGNPGYWYDGLMSEVNFVDGYALQPTLFGQFDSNNAWVPIPYTGSYGTNGFYLPFTNAQTSQTLGYDASLNGTTTYGADQDPYRGSVALHLTGNGPAGGQNGTFTDSSTNNLAVTRQGSVITQGSFSPFPLPANVPYNPALHGASGYFNNTPGENLLVAASSVNAIGTSAFTLEIWVYIKSGKSSVTGNGGHTIISQGNNASNLMWQLYIAIDGSSLYWGLTTQAVTVTTTVPINAWAQIAITRDSSNNERIFVNGALVNTRTNTSNYNSVSGYQIQIGSSYDTNYPGVYSTNSYSNTLWGYVSSTRLIIGSAVYTSAFTPMMKPFGTLTNNLIGFSEDFTNTIWNKSSSTVVSGAAIAPDGAPSALAMYETAAVTAHAIWQNLASNSSIASYTWSAHIKANGRTWSAINAYCDGSNHLTFFDLTNGVVGTNPSGSTSSITNVGNGWYRCVITRSVTTAATIGLEVWSASADNTSSFLGDVTKGLYIWGVQLEQTSSVGNYTPTPANYSTAPSLLLNFANAAVVDSSGSNNAITTGNATVTSSSKFGSGALAFNGSTDYLTIPSSTTLSFGTGNFTVEGWINPSSQASGYGSFYAATTTGGLIFSVKGAGTPTSIAVNAYGSSDTASFSYAFVQNTWYHVAVTRYNYTTQIFVNGQSLGSATDSASYTQTSINIGGISGQYYNGLIDDLRVTKGVARYTSSFTPPARALPETGGKSFVTVNVNAGVVKSFTTVGTTSWTAPTDVTQIEVLVVAGGGGGGGVGNSQGGGGGGGGAGGLLYNNQYPVTPGQTYTILVGAGGTAGPGPGTTGQGGNGGNSQFGNLIAIGGGGGDDADRGHGALSGGSGGGGGGGGAGGRAGASGTPGQGFSGTTGYGSGQNYPGGGGGGAGGVGSTPTASAAGGGGAGLGFGISGTYQYYAGGGGGGINTTTYGSPTLGAGGSGVGGNGGVNSIGLSGTNGTGGGGGAGGGDTGHAGGAGGSGIVIVRYTTQTVANTSDSTTDNLVDSPTLYGHDFGLGGEVVGNYNTLNPLWSNQVNYLNGNLTVTPVTGNAGYCHFISSIAMPSTGYWYAEFTINTLPYPSGNNNMLGIVLANATANAPPIGTYFGYNSTEYSYLDAGGFRTNNTTSQTASAWAANDVIMIALGNGNVWFGRNGVWQGSGSPNPATATSPAYTGLNGNYQFAGNTYGGGYGGQISANFGQRAWQYTPPAGYQALTTKNFQRPTITPNQHFAANTWTQGTTDVTIVNTGGFQPDLVWIKARNNAQNHYLIDSVRGATSLLRSNAATAESTGSTWVTFNSNGFVPSSANTVTNTYTYVAWQWKAGGTAVTNNVGTISAQVSANTTSGFSIITYTGNGATTATVGHGLNATPSFVLYKGRTAAAGDQNWVAMHTSLGTGNYIYLNSTNASTAFSTAFPWTSTTISANTTFNTSGATYVAYCWAETPGFSKFGTYAGNSSTDGPFIYCGFTPAMVIIKGTFSAAASQWYVYDNGRDPAANPLLNRLLLNTTDADTNGTSTDIDFVSNGFKLRYPAGGGGLNSTGSNYIYMAFAASPFGNANGTAR